MGQHVVGANQSLWAFTKQQLGAGATKTEIARAAQALAKENGLTVDARLTQGQTLLVPDKFERGVTSTATADATARLRTRPGPDGGVVARAQHQAKPLVQIEPAFSPVSFDKGDAVTLPAIAGVLVTAHELKMTSVRSSSVHETALRSVQAELGVLTEAQFHAVHGALGGHSGVTFDPARSYAVEDFLPPALQALLHTDLEITDPLELKGTRQIGEDFGFGRDNKTVYFTMNCHATAWEAMRAYQGERKDEVAIFYGEMIMMDGLTHEPGFELVGELKPDRIGELLALDLRPGDVVQFHQDAMLRGASTDLMHSAVYVGAGLFFEKPNTEGSEKEDRAHYITQDETPFRLATVELMSTPLREATDGQYRVEVRRPTEKLKDAHEVFRTALQNELEAWAKKKGRVLGVDLVSMLEQGMGGNIRGEMPSVLVRVPLAKKDDGTAVLKTP